MNISSVIRNALLYLKNNGISNTVKYGLYRMDTLWIEHQLGIETRQFVKLREIGLDNETFRDYMPTPYQDLRTVMKKLAIRGGEDVFLDYGSGMGRVVIYAATCPFHKVIGVEVSPELSAIARKNIQCARKKLKCKEIQIVTTDAASYVVPPDVTTIFLYNPFRKETLARVFQQVRASIESYPPDGWRAEVGGCDWLYERNSFLSFDGLMCYIYENYQ